MVLVFAAVFSLAALSFSAGAIPSVGFETPTPGNGSTKYGDWIYVNVSASDATYNVSAFIDWNKSLAGWWTFDSLNGTGDVVDYLGLNNGSVVGNTTQDNGYLGKGFNFSDIGHIDLGTSQFGIDNSGEFTISLWGFGQSRKGTNHRHSLSGSNALDQSRFFSVTHD